MGSCLGDETLAALAAGSLDPQARRGALVHLDGCDACRQLVTHVLDTCPAPPGSWPHSAIVPGATIGRYVIDAHLGAGAMGIVYTARDPDLRRRVALKVLRPDPALTAQDVRERLLSEARAMAQLSHPNVVAIHDVGVHGDEVFFAMELIDGGTLRDWLAAAPRTWREILAAFRRAGDGLAAAHAVGLVHRDFKLDNVLVGRDGRICVTDFGLARTAQAGVAVAGAGPIDALVRTGAVVGTPAYMAPEQLAGSRADARSDLFSFCVALYEALYGERPFQASTIAELTEAIARGELRPPPPGKRIPTWLRRTVLHGLRPAPEDRPVGIAEMCRALERGAMRRRRAIAAGLALAVGGALAVALAWPGSAPAPAPPAPPRALAVTDVPLPASASQPALEAYRRGLLNLRDGVAAGHDFAQAAGLDPTLAEAHLRFALAEFWRVPVDAREHLTRAIALRSRLGPRDQRLLAAAQAWIQDQPADRDAYARMLIAAQAEFPLDAELTLRAAGAVHESGDRPGALALYDRALAIDPAFGAAFAARADILAYDGRLDDAFAAIEECTQRAPEATACLAQRTLLDGLSGNCQRAERDAQRILAHDPSSDVGYYQLAQEGYAQGRPLPVVRELLRERVARLPDALRSRFESWHAWALDVLTGDFEAARDQARALDRTAGADADRRLHARAAYWWTSASLESGRPLEAAQRARDFLARRDAWLAEPRAEDFSILRDLTPRLLAAERAGGLLSAAEFEAERTRWVELWERSAIPVARPFVWLHGYAAIAESADDARRALAAAPRSGVPRYTPFTLGDAFIGTTYYLAGRIDDALPYLQRAARSCVALEVPFEHTQVHLVLGQALAARGRRDEACAALGVVLARWGHARPRSVTADRARQLAQTLGCRVAP